MKQFAGNTPLSEDFRVADKPVMDDPGYKRLRQQVATLLRQGLFPARDFAGGEVRILRNRSFSKTEREATVRTQSLRFNGAVERDPAIDAWMKEHAGELGAIAHQWFEVMRRCGDEVRELLHDGCPVACLGDAPFGYVNVFTSHVNVGFFHGAALPDPARLLQGAGKRMRHVKLRPGTATNAAALSKLIDAAYSDIKARVENG
jgi:hypothetical protein